MEAGLCNVVEGMELLRDVVIIQNLKTKFLHIFLAYFNPIDISNGILEIDENDEQKPISDKLIDGKIINQRGWEFKFDKQGDGRIRIMEKH